MIGAGAGIMMMTSGILALGEPTGYLNIQILVWISRGTWGLMLLGGVLMAAAKDREHAHRKA
ncbi:MAG: hypothetical protein AAB420_01240 [Patescibacteria group bacterium]